MTSRQADLILQELDIYSMLENTEEVDCLAENNPELLDAYKAMIKFAKRKDKG